MNDPIRTAIRVLVLLALLGLAWWLFALLPVPPIFRTIALIAVVVIALLWLARAAGAWCVMALLFGAHLFLT